MGGNLFWVIIIAVGVLLVCALLVATGVLSQKGPRGPGGPLDPEI